MNVYVPEAKESFFKKKQQNSKKLQIVQNVFGIAKPGKVLAIMGASGAGHLTQSKIKIQFLIFHV